MSGAYLSFANFRLGTVRVIPLFCRQTDLLLSLAARTMIKLVLKNESYVEKREKKGRIFLRTNLFLLSVNLHCFLLVTFLFLLTLAMFQTKLLVIEAYSLVLVSKRIFSCIACVTAESPWLEYTFIISQNEVRFEVRSYYGTVFKSGKERQ